MGKSSLALAEAVAMASGRDLLGQPANAGPLAVWYWNGEDPLEEIERRVGAILLHYGIGPEEIAGRLFLNSGRDCSIVIAATTRGGTTIAEPVIAAMTATITARCAFGRVDGMKSIRECTHSYRLDMPTLVWTRGPNFPLSGLQGRLMCPMCRSRSVRLVYDVPNVPRSVSARR